MQNSRALHLSHSSLSSELKSSAQRRSFLGDYADGARLRERCHINLSLMTLSTIIRKLRSDTALGVWLEEIAEILDEVEQQQRNQQQSRNQQH
ncbi:kinesin-like protein KIN-7A [Actinidia eriantha]|uniref:kinesin-like protein KIN-7A n=1 Tax=Actinidia eriantha TaxID=165200 RepID=UPI002582E4AB|nr:kinesin-like protein KIN-7A [Actinidia eriantha]